MNFRKFLASATLAAAVRFISAPLTFIWAPLGEANIAHPVLV